VGAGGALHPRAAELLGTLNLTPHPEGGFFREIHRSRQYVDAGDGRPPRAALTVIYFLLPASETSRWHRVRSDEAWHHLEGAPLELFQADPDFAGVTRQVLGRHDDHAEPVHIVPSGHWQAARSTGAFTLVACDVGPGFDFLDFDLLRNLPDAATLLRVGHPEMTDLL
jgi:uncharacterized protein